MQNKILIKDIIHLIKKYTKQYSEILSEECLTESALESYTTLSKLVADDYFKDNKKDEIKIKDFEKTIILFTDLKNSTKILEKCEKENILVYIAYIHYSTMLLAEILNLFQGRLIESTGDGTYAIISNNENKLEHAIDELIINQKEGIESFVEIKEYLSNFEQNELTYIFKEKKYIQNSFPYEERIRTFFFIIFAIFNYEINNLDILKKLRIKFLTRVGCKIGSCKISRINIPNHILQDKLIGSIVHKAAHQVSGK